MDRRSLTDRATDCTLGSTDWTTIGARIQEAALIASAIHARECSRPARLEDGLMRMAADGGLSPDRESSYGN